MRTNVAVPGSHRRARGRWLLAAPLGLLALLPLAALAQPEAGVEYRSFFGFDSRTAVWVTAQLHLMFGAFVLGVPIFALITEYIGHQTGDQRYDRLAHEFTKLLSAAFATTASLGGLFAFLLFGLYPRFMNFMGDAFHGSTYIYALLFFGEVFFLYLYYYSWERMQGGRKKWLHMGVGLALNLTGIVIMAIANSWVTYMMSPTGIEPETNRFVGSAWGAIANPLWMPLNVHRLIANVAFGGFVVGAYAAVRFLGSSSEEERAHYDWMGYVGNFIGMGALIPLPFAGYWLGREIYSLSPVMGNNMMGGAFSWTFIIQAMLIGMLFIGANFYLWNGMGRIPGADRYQGFIKWINLSLILCFAVWLTPHNLPLSSAEQVLMGGQYHRVLKYLGLMPAKNAAVNFIILSTFLSFLLYRRGNKGERLPFAAHGLRGRLVVGGAGAVSILLLLWFARVLFTLDPHEMDLLPDRRVYFLIPAYLLFAQAAVAAICVWMTYRDGGVVAQFIYLGTAVFFVTFFLGVYGFVVLEKANPFLREIAVVQVLIVLTALIFVTAVDVYVFRGAKEVGGIQWGKVPIRAQYTLILLCVSVVLLMG
ncbi:MAG: cytochrome ubiquinol oxidase subunit I, partial [bacterium]